MNSETDSLHRSGAKGRQAATGRRPAPASRKRYTVGLPIQIASRLEALCELYPDKTRAEVMADVLGVGLAHMERAWSRSGSSPDSEPPDLGQSVYLLTGPFADFRGLTLKHHSVMARELAKEEPERIHPLDAYLLDAHD